MYLLYSTKYWQVWIILFVAGFPFKFINETISFNQYFSPANILHYMMYGYNTVALLNIMFFFIFQSSPNGTIKHTYQLLLGSCKQDRCRRLLQVIFYQQLGSATSLAYQCTALWDEILPVHVMCCPTGLPPGRGHKCNSHFQDESSVYLNQCLSPEITLTRINMQLGM